MGIGANLGAAEAAVRRALRDLGKLGRVRASSLYRTEPLGAPSDPWYVNAVAELDTPLAAAELWRELRALERLAGRPDARPRFAPRALDLDLLLHGDSILATPELTVPHPGLARRRFVLAPLAELAPELVPPGLPATVAKLLADLDDPLRVEKLPENQGVLR